MFLRMNTPVFSSRWTLFKNSKKAERSLTESMHLLLITELDRKQQCWWSHLKNKCNSKVEERKVNSMNFQWASTRHDLIVCKTWELFLFVHLIIIKSLISFTCTHASKDANMLNNIMTSTSSFVSCTSWGLLCQDTFFPFHIIIINISINNKVCMS